MQEELIQASREGSLQNVEKLVSAGCEVDATDLGGRTALMLACMLGHVEVASFLLQRGASVTTKDSLGRTPLIFASFGGNVEVIKQLLSAGADPNAVDHHGKTPLIHAAVRGNRSAASLLLERGADPRHKDKNGRTADDWGRMKAGKHWLEDTTGNLTRPWLKRLPWALIGNVVLVIIGGLIAVWWFYEPAAPKPKAAVPKAPPLESDYVTVRCGKKVLSIERPSRPGLPVIVHTSEGHITLLPGESLSDHGVTYGLRKPKAKILHQLFAGARECKEREIQEALCTDIDVNSVDAEGRTAFSLAAEHNCSRAGKLLLDRGANINNADESGRTPLMWACRIGNYDMIDLLLSKGADRKTKDRNGRTALAHMQDHFNIVRQQRIEGTKESQQYHGTVILDAPF